MMLTTKELALKLGISEWALRKAVKTGRITAQRNEHNRMVFDFDTAKKQFDANRAREKNHSYKDKNPNALKPKRKNANKLEKHIGSSEVQDAFDFTIECNDLATFDKILDVDADGAPPKGSVAYYQARKLAIDSVRNYVKLLQETGELLALDDAKAIFADQLVSISAAIQNMPARTIGRINAAIKKNVKEWNDNGEVNSETETMQILTDSVREILAQLSNANKAAKEQTGGKNGQKKGK